jgi:hypothetical protein
VPAPAPAEDALDEVRRRLQLPAVAMLAVGAMSVLGGLMVFGAMGMMNMKRHGLCLAVDGDLKRDGLPRTELSGAARPGAAGVPHVGAQGRAGPRRGGVSGASASS